MYVEELCWRDQTPEDLRLFAERYRNDIALFATEIFHRRPDDNQKKIYEMIRTKKRICIGSGRGVGKSVALIISAYWFCCCYPDALVGLTANTADQVSRVLMRYAKDLLARSAIRDWFIANQDGVKDNNGEKRMVRIIWDEKNIERVSGLHAENLMIMLDEASLMPGLLITSLLSGLTGPNNKMILSSNTTRASGYYFECFSNPKWDCLTIDSRSSEFTNKDHIQSLIDQYGEDSDTVRVQVRGLFPKESSTRLFTPTLVQNLRANHDRDFATCNRNNYSVMGIDVGAGGDATAWALHSGNDFYILKTKQTRELTDLLDETQRLVREYNVNEINVDSTGVGALVPSALRPILQSVTINGINFGAASTSIENANKRTEIYRNLSAYLENHDCKIHVADYLAPDLFRALELVEVNIQEKTGNFILCPKADIVSELGHSPDTMDALALTCATPEHYASSMRQTSKKMIMRRMMAASKWGDD
jgi:Terminase-like family.